MNPAHSALVTICAHLSMTVVRDDNFTMWTDCLRMVLRDCDDCPDALLGLRAYAREVVEARTALARNNALSRLHWETKTYFVKAAGSYFEAWKDSKSTSEAAA